MKAGAPFSRECADPALLPTVNPPDLHAELRPYQQVGVNWLRFVTRLGLGACLADDMGLGKTIQVISVLLHLHEDGEISEPDPGGTDKNVCPTGHKPPSLLIVPASLIANWK